MLQIKEICKEYRTGALVQKALDHVSLNLRDSEFVAILGPSGSGKTTFLNVIGGLDRYDSGDLIINGVSTKQYKDRDWDAYRNHTIGFVFQSYNLIMHQSILSNVELALTISGISGSERRSRAEDALRKVGLGDQMHKKPAQLSGGQMQRVAIARALVNNPDIVLADEPTGALDSETSIQVMQLLKEVAKDRLVVMVTHNPELAHAYATRIVTIKDGRIDGDTDPYEVPVEEEPKPVYKKQGKASMSFLTALSLSFQNLLTKKARTILVSFAGSIGIIGIALILALSTGANRYIQAQESETLSQYPLQIRQTGYDLTSMMSGNASGGGLFGSRDEDVDKDKVGVSDIVDSLLSGVNTNDLKALKGYFDSGESGIEEYVNGIEYDYNVTPRIYRYDEKKDKVYQMNPNNLFSSMATGQIDMSSMMSGTLGADYFSSLPISKNLYEDTYDVKAGHWPSADNELVLVLTEEGKVSDLLLYELGLRNEDALEERIKSLSTSGQGDTSASSSSDAAAAASTDVSASSDSSATAATSSSEKADSVTEAASSVSSSTSTENETYSYDTFLGRTFKLVNNADLYTYDSNYGAWEDRSDDTSYVKNLVKKGKDLKIVGIVQPKEGSTTSALSPGLAYPHDLITDLIDENAKSGVVKAQLADPDTNVLTGNTFAEENSEAGAGFDLSKLFTVNTDAIQQAFQVNTNDMNMDDLTSNLDLGNLNASNLNIGNINLADLIDVNTLAASLPSISEADLRSILSGVKVTGTSEQLQSLFSSIMSGYTQSLSANPATDYSKLGEYLGNYLQSSAFTTTLKAVMQELLNESAANAVSEADMRSVLETVVSGYLNYAKEKELDATDPSNFGKYLTDGTSGGSAAVTQALQTIVTKMQGFNITDAQLASAREKILQGYDTYASANDGPVLSELTKSFSEYVSSSAVQQQLSEAAAGLLDTSAVENTLRSALQQTMSSVTNALSSQLNTAMQGILQQVTGSLQTALQQSMQNVSGQMQSSLADMFKVDPNVLASAVQTNLDAGQIRDLMTSLVSGTSNSYEDNLSSFGYQDKDTPSAILIYSKNFDAKNQVTNILDNYNKRAEKAGKDDQVIHYTDMIAAMMASVTKIINAISYILIGFVAISLVVSSIMIGVITYISVLERRKEIGILRAMGASKHNVAQVFNAETFITGLLAGAIGVGVTVILTYPANWLIRKISQIDGIHAFLPPQAAALLILLSVVLTMIAGLIPAGKASRSDPVAALRASD